jgi:hypothetical protein
MRRLTQLSLHAYPPSFRARYGAEMAALIEDLPNDRRTTTDLLTGAARAWLRPSFTGPTAVRQRLQATAATTWVAWCTAFCVVPAMTKALLDPPPPGPDGGIWALMNVATGLIVAGWVLTLAGALAIVVKALIPALRSPQRRLLLPLLPPLWLGLIEGAALATWIRTSHGNAQRLVHPAHAGALVAILIGFLAFLIALAAGPAATLPRLNTSMAHLKMAALLAVPVALLLAAATGCCIVAAVVSAAPGAVMFGNGVVAPLVLAFAGVASLVALVSSARGVRALRQA